MKIKEWAEFHGFTDEDAARIDTIKKMFGEIDKEKGLVGAKIDIVRTDKEYKEWDNSRIKNNKINIDKLWIKV